MIFVSVGMQMPFDRLCQTVDNWAGNQPDNDIFMQIGSTSWKPRHCEYAQLIDPKEYSKYIQRASVLVMHAGIGSILAAMEYGKPIIVMPRKAALKETRNDHQIATARMFTNLGGIAVASDEVDLHKQLDSLDKLNKPASLSPNASNELITAIRAFIHGEM